MGPITAFTSFFARYFDVYGRSRRSEFGWMVLIHLTAMVALYMVIRVFEDGTVSTAHGDLSAVSSLLISATSLVWIGMLIPWTTLTVRRFHDMGQSGWLVALFAGLWIIPPIGMIGSVVQFFWILFGAGTAGSNAYGHDPRFSGGLEFN
ncbi:MAG: DUF805 domain-containing protein [Pseudomonadota bacterium]